MSDSNTQDSPFISRKRSDSSDPFISRKQSDSIDQKNASFSHTEIPSVNSEDVHNDPSVVTSVASDISVDNSAEIEEIKALVNKKLSEIDKSSNIIHAKLYEEISAFILKKLLEKNQHMSIKQRTEIFKEISPWVLNKLADADKNNRVNRRKQRKKKLYIRLIVYVTALVIMIMLHKHL